MKLSLKRIAIKSIAISSLVLTGFGTAYAADAQCDKLQQQKALIHAAHGYCFKDEEAIKKYGNSDCHTKKPKFSGPEAKRLAQIEEKEKELKDVMYQGEVAALPYVLDEMTGCDYCGCRDICGFDQRIEGCEYRRLRKYTLEEALNSMKERLGILEEKGEAGE